MFKPSLHECLRPRHFCMKMPFYYSLPSTGAPIRPSFLTCMAFSNQFPNCLCSMTLIKVTFLCPGNTKGNLTLFFVLKPEAALSRRDREGRSCLPNTQQMKLAKMWKNRETGALSRKQFPIFKRGLPGNLINPIRKEKCNVCHISFQMQTFYFRL